RPEFTQVAREDEITLVAESVEEPVGRGRRSAQLLAQEHLQTGPEDEIAAAKPLIGHHAGSENDGPCPALPRDRIRIEPGQPDQRAAACAPETDFRQLEELALVVRARRLDVAFGQRPDLIELGRGEGTAPTDRNVD